MKELLKNAKFFVCEECGRKFDTKKAISNHVVRMHDKLKYYDKYLFENGDGKCLICSNATVFFGIKGYAKTCSKECQNKLISNIVKNNSSFRKQYWIDKGYTLEEIELKFKQKSIWSEEYWKKNGIENPKEAVSNIQSKNANIFVENRKINPTKYSRITKTQVGYWIDKGLTEDEAKQKVKERQSTFTLEKCIAKYGEIEGTKKFNDRQEKWSIKIEEQYKNGDFSRAPKTSNSTRISIMSKTIISELLKIYPDAICYENEFEIFDKEHGKWMGFDFKVGKKIIEINGDYWHCNPTKYKADYYHTSLKMTAQEKWNYDKRKIEFAKSKGFDVLEVWESDIKENKNNVIDTCLQFLKSIK